MRHHSDEGFGEARLLIPNSVLGAELPRDLMTEPQPVMAHVGEEMMLDLEVQAAEEVIPDRMSLDVP